MNSRNKKRVKGLIIGIGVVILLLVLVHVLGNYAIPWIIRMHQ